MQADQETLRVVVRVCERHERDRTRLMDIALELHSALEAIDPDAVDALAHELGIPRVGVESLISFYSFLGHRPRGLHVIHLSDDVVDHMQGADAVARALEQELDVRFGQTTDDGTFTLE